MPVPGQRTPGKPAGGGGGVPCKRAGGGGRGEPGNTRRPSHASRSRLDGAPIPGDPPLPFPPQHLTHTHPALTPEGPALTTAQPPPAQPHCANGKDSTAAGDTGERSSPPSAPADPRQPGPAALNHPGPA